MAITAFGLVWILFGHWVGDFLLQNSWMGLNKYNKLWPLTAHCLVVTWVLFVFFCFLSDLNFVKSFEFAIINGVAHFAIDFVTSRITHKTWGWAAHPRVFWNTIGFDQFLHMAIYVASIQFLLG